MPLSEEEQRILRQIEQELEQDPTFSQRGYRVSRRRSLLLVLGLIGGLALTIGGLALNFLFAFAGFILVLVVALMLETELRLLGRERLGQLPISAWLSGRRPSGVAAARGRRSASASHRARGRARVADGARLYRCDWGNWRR